jgi:hypothetical protein
VRSLRYGQVAGSLLSRRGGEAPVHERFRRISAALAIEVVNAETPRRLPLGQMAIDHIRTRLLTHREELEAWVTLSSSGDFPD